MKTPITITAIWSRRSGDYVETLAEIDGQWHLVCREYFDGPFSHIAEGNGADKWLLSTMCPDIEERPMTEGQIKHMANRFLMWRLPNPWRPDNGISYARPNYAHAPADHDWPTGTNLFGYTQAEEMVRHMAEGMPPTPATVTGVGG